MPSRTEEEELGLDEFREAVENYWEYVEVLKPTENVRLENPVSYVEERITYSVSGYEERIDRKKNQWKFVITGTH